LPRDFRWMTSLKSLFLNHNKISQLESLDSISCLQLVKLDIENNYVCRVPGFRRYVQTHFKWLESLDRKSISHRNLQNDMYETPIESIHEDRGINE
jgi:Leucine-rich repeat (LRR) protein